MKLCGKIHSQTDHTEYKKEERERERERGNEMK